MNPSLLNFRPASEVPLRPYADTLSAECLILNPCDGFHITWARWCSIDGEFLGFFDFASPTPWPAESVAAWAALPDPHQLAQRFYR